MLTIALSKGRILDDTLPLLAEAGIKTVEQHRARVMEKLQVDSLAELVRLVVGMGGAEASKNGQ